ncbi:SDR family NAD(P)-dependent oxidoreductase [Bradyrhizobium sp. CCBAU 53338]|uniref:SDR family NAD(P)-dependent oxidoreductase n=1 Tax=Bradyrhizobium sp. CCBAU 53338 TaxID=1325111 RepID=UPI00188B2076|nr:SDR family oxidoreductase [Bradyrhizobium sp. CCBAU 53338]QOZ52496.1 short-chain dehydrogenase [Bradyrhizobium sp. CCBAU 53338]
MSIKANSSTAVVTGGSTGIGAAICHSLIAEGHDVVNLDAKPLSWTHERVRHEEVDLSDAEATRAAASKVARTSEVGIFVHNAGAICPALVEAAEPKDLTFLTDLHLSAPLILLQAFLPAMKAQRNGRVVLISSRALLGVPTRTAYAATKAGMVGMGRTWALELAQYGITVNMVAPGPIGSTDMFRALAPDGSEQANRIAKTIPVGRLGRPEDVANAVLFFVSGRSTYVTGQTLFVCGGASVGTLTL